MIKNSEKLIDEKLEIVLKELDSEKWEFWNLPPFFEKIIAFLLQMNVIFKIIFLLLLAAFIVFLLYKVSGLFMRNKMFGTERTKDNANKAIPEPTTVDYLKSAMDKSLQKEYSQAIILLHKGSVNHLFNKKILSKGRDYTNREIQKTISHKETSKAFYNMAFNAELIAFKGKKAFVDEYEEMELLFRRYFYEL